MDIICMALSLVMVVLAIVILFQVLLDWRLSLKVRELKVFIVEQLRNR